MNLQTLFTRLGLSVQDGAIYLSLLRHGATTVSGIAQRTGLFRPVIYKALPILLEKGLISFSPKGKQRQYVAESPEKIERLFGELQTAFHALLPELQNLATKRGLRPSIKFLEGRSGLSHVFEDLVTSLKKGDVFYRYSAPRGDLAKGEKYLPKDYRERRDQKRLERFVITTEAVAKLKKPRLERSVKTVPAEYGLFEYGITQLVYGDKVAIIDYNTETALVIENPIIAEFQKKVFRILYDKL